MAIVRKSVSAQAKSTELKFGRINYLEINPVNANKTLVLLHGLGADKDTWLSLIKHLNNEFRVIAPDLPGHGDSYIEDKNNYSIHSQATRIGAFLQQLNIDHCHLLGHSMGGAIAAKIAHSASIKAESLILISTYGIPAEPSIVELMVKHSCINPMLEINNKKDYKQMMQLAMVQKPYVPGFILSVLAQRAQQQSKMYQSILNQCETELDITEYLANQNAPILVIWGKEDKVLNMDAVNTLKNRLNDFDLFTMNQTGHVPAVEKPDITAARISQFVEKVTAPSDSINNLASATTGR